MTHPNLPKLKPFKQKPAPMAPKDKLEKIKNSNSAIDQSVSVEDAPLLKPVVAISRLTSDIKKIEKDEINNIIGASNCQKSKSSISPSQKAKDTTSVQDRYQINKLKDLIEEQQMMSSEQRKQNKESEPDNDKFHQLYDQQAEISEMYDLYGQQVEDKDLTQKMQLMQSSQPEEMLRSVVTPVDESLGGQVIHESREMGLPPIHKHMLAKHSSNNGLMNNNIDSIPNSSNTHNASSQALIGKGGLPRHQMPDNIFTDENLRRHSSNAGFDDGLEQETQKQESYQGKEIKIRKSQIKDPIKLPTSNKVEKN
jgi:hypothetical protein